MIDEKTKKINIFLILKKYIDTFQKNYYISFQQCSGGGIGRRACFRCMLEQFSGGSSPLQSTILTKGNNITVIAFLFFGQKI